MLAGLHGLDQVRAGTKRTAAQASVHGIAKMRRTVVVNYPASEKYTTDALLAAFGEMLPDWTITTDKDKAAASRTADLQLCDYDELDWDAAAEPSCLTNAYIHRKVHNIPNLAPSSAYLHICTGAHP